MGLGGSVCNLNSITCRWTFILIIWSFLCGAVVTDVYNIIDVIVFVGFFDGYVAVNIDIIDIRFAILPRLLVSFVVWFINANNIFSFIEFVLDYFLESIGEFFIFK